MQQLKVIEFNHGLIIVPFNANVKLSDDQKPLMAGTASECGLYLERYLLERERGTPFERAHKTAVAACGMPMVPPPNNG